MVCQRCRGLLICETFDDLSSGTDSLQGYTLHQLWVYQGFRDASQSLPQFGEHAGAPRRRRRTGDVERITIPSEAHASIQ
jgi:hypothetical protein